MYKLTKTVLQKKFPKRFIKIATCENMLVYNKENRILGAIDFLLGSFVSNSLPAGGRIVSHRQLVHSVQLPQKLLSLFDPDLQIYLSLQLLTLIWMNSEILTWFLSCIHAVSQNKVKNKKTWFSTRASSMHLKSQIFYN